jgi:hypothetical protein
MQTLSKYYTLHLIVNTKDVAPLLSELPLKGVHVQNIERGINPLKDLNCLISMVRFLRKQQFDAIQSVSPKAGLMAMLGGLLLMFPCEHILLQGKYGQIKKEYLDSF